MLKNQQNSHDIPQKKIHNYNKSHSMQPPIPLITPYSIMPLFYYTNINYSLQQQETSWRLLQQKRWPTNDPKKETAN